VNDEHSAPDGQSQETTSTTEQPARRAPGKPGASRTEKATALEVARLFGLPPRLLVSPTRPPDGGKDDEQEPA
jgi:hypothetical protein